MQRLLEILFVLFYILGIYSGVTTDQEIPSSTQTPSAESYSQEQLLSRVPWDMIIIDEKLYLGGGDYSANTGPVDIWCKDLKTGLWSVSGTLNDESIGKFIRIDDRIYAPGFDSKEGTWETGNYHWLENNQWYTNTQLPNAVHNFDIAHYDSKLFFAIGTSQGNISPIKVSDDQGLSFQDIPIIIDGTDVIAEDMYDFTRVYSFFQNDQGLFCLFAPTKSSHVENYYFCHYNNGVFESVSTYSQLNMTFKKSKQEPICSTVSFEGNSYIATGTLTRTSDFKTAEEILLPLGEDTYDLLISDGQLFVLSALPGETGYTIRIYRYVYNSFLYPVVSFESENAPVSFEKFGNTYYVGLNKTGTNENATGSIIEIQAPNITI